MKQTNISEIRRKKWFIVSMLCISLLFFILAHSADSLVHRGYAKMCNNVDEDCYFKEIRIFKNGYIINRCICLKDNYSYEIKNIEPEKNFIYLITSRDWSEYN